MAGEAVQQIKDKLDIAEFLRGYLAVQPAGRNFKANCPFHKEKTPSFMISPERQTWHCFGCGIGGDIFAFVMKYESLEFAEALKILADKAGVELKRTNPQEYQFFGVLYDINEAAKEFYRNQLEASPVATKYVQERGLTPTTIHTFEIGWAPNSVDALTLHLLNQGFAPDAILRAGVNFKTERGMQMDRFRGRIMFPIHNHLGKVVGFTGRILPQFDTGDMGKYVNSPETSIFQKSKLLYGFWKSKTSIRERKSAFLVEGQMDFLMSYQAGVTNAVATSGTALTIEHLTSIHKITDELLLSFDNDDAGWTAAERAIDLAEANDFSVKVVTLTGVKDPAEAAQKDPKALERAIANARPALEVYFDKYLGPSGISLADREGLRKLRLVLAKIQNVSSPAERSLWLGKLSNRTGIPQSALVEEADKLKQLVKNTVMSQPVVVPDEKRMLTRRELLSEELLSAAYAKKDLAIIQDEAVWFPPNYRAVYDALLAGNNSAGIEVIDNLISLISLKADTTSDADIASLKTHLKGEYLKDRRHELTAQVQRDEALGKDVSGLLDELKKLSS